MTSSQPTAGGWEPDVEVDAEWRSIEGYVHSTESAGMVDGPGVRYVVFTQGCPLACQYCHNPDSRAVHGGSLTTAGAMVDEIARFASFLKRARGGLTISGGEPLMQPAFTEAVLRGAQDLGLHTALDTSGFLGAQATDEFLEAVDLVLLDIKSFRADTYRRVTGVNVAPTLEFAERLAFIGKPTWIRYVLVPGLTDDFEEIGQLADFVATLGNVERVEVLPFHKMGEYKWFERDLRY
ncbi:MAG TPA: pyruvate formate-lyase-activating protein, partial [Gemmatimonadaceae bacterium]|nr:pyruvate formate-lyase-activating protein [Gemmatimonadaceae bacterium]